MTILFKNRGIGIHKVSAFKNTIIYKALIKFVFFDLKMNSYLIFLNTSA